MLNKKSEMNTETLEALKELEEMKKNPERYKSYTDVNEMMIDILNGSRISQRFITIWHRSIVCRFKAAFRAAK